MAGTYTLKATGGKLTPDFSNPFTISVEDVSSSLSIKRGALLPVPRQKGQSTNVTNFKETILITNTGKQALTGPLGLVLESLPTNVALMNESGTYQSNPYLNVLGDGKVLSHGQSVMVTLDFSVTGNASNAQAAVSYALDALLGI